MSRFWAVPTTLFQSTRPRGARHTDSVIHGRLVRFQSTRPRGARPLGERDRATGEVSIHAPARGATCCGRLRPPSCRRFNPRAREGRDGRAPRARCGRRRFNPRAREGRDLSRSCGPGTGRGFNPRAREGRDTERRSWTRCRLCFNPRAREGRDSPTPSRSTAYSGFQSTRPRGARRWRRR